MVQQPTASIVGDWRHFCCGDGQWIFVLLEIRRPTIEHDFTMLNWV
jgi:hypothetical protein